MCNNSSHTAHLLRIASDALLALQQRLRPAGDDAEHVSSWERCLEQDQLVGGTVDILRQRDLAQQQQQHKKTD
jgi:transcriptional regulator of acetoin/glycerol metabolism